MVTEAKGPVQTLTQHYSAKKLLRNQVKALLPNISSWWDWREGTKHQGKRFWAHTVQLPF